MKKQVFLTGILMFAENAKPIHPARFQGACAVSDCKSFRSRHEGDQPGLSMLTSVPIDFNVKKELYHNWNAEKARSENIRPAPFSCLANVPRNRYNYFKRKTLVNKVNKTYSTSIRTSRKELKQAFGSIVDLFGEQHCWRLQRYWRKTRGAI